MAIVKFEKVQKDVWYNISLFANKCKSYGRTINYFEATFDGESWRDINDIEYHVDDIIFINDELAF